MLCIRISEQEYEGLRSVSEASGGRSISDLARQAVSRLIDPPAESATPELALRVEEIDIKLEALRLDLQRLERQVLPSPDSSPLTHDDLLALEAANGT